MTRLRLRDFGVLEWAIALAIAAGVVYRFAGFSNLPGLNGDEVEWANNMLLAHAGESWPLRTPTGKILNPVLCAMLWGLTGIFEPAVWVARAPALLSGLLLLALAYPLLRRAFDARVALFSALLLAASPMAIVYSRLGWDPCQSALACLLAIAFAYQRRWSASGAAFLWALLIHPTNLFLLPVLLGGPLLEWAIQRARTDLKKPKLALLMAIGAAAAGWALLLTLQFIAGDAWKAVGTTTTAEYIDRLLVPSQWVSLLTQYGRLLGGITAMQYAAGIQSEATLAVLDRLFWGIYLPVTLFGILMLARRRKWKELGLIGGLLAALALFQIRATWQAMLPASERYAQWIVVPGVLAFALGLREIAEARGRTLASAVAVLAASLQLWSFQTYFVDDLLRDGGRNHWTFFTGEREPKAAAFETILSDSGGRPGVVIWAEDFWSREPMRFFTAKRERWVVRPTPPAGISADWLRTELDSGAYLVGFWNGAIEQALPQLGESYALRKWTFSTFARSNSGRPILSVWRKHEVQPPRKLLPQRRR